MVNESQETIEHKVDQQEYLGRLTETDRKNLQSWITALGEVLREKGRRGVLKAVGGTINKPLPRKDLDLTLRLSEQPEDPKRDNFENYLEFSKAHFKIFREIVEDAVKRCSNLSIDENGVTEPVMEEEYQNPSILKNDGSIKIKPREGTIIEIIRKREHTTTIENEPYVILKAA